MGENVGPTDETLHDEVVAEESVDAVLSGDMVADVVEQVRADLEEQRRTGRMPRLPDGELDRQFDGVVEAVEGAVVELPPIGSDGLGQSAGLQTWKPDLGPGLVPKLVAFAFSPLLRVFGFLVRRQVREFSLRAAEVVNEVVDRQNRMQKFLARAHLDRVRSLEYRVAELERELVALRGPDDDGPGDGER